MKSTLIQGKQAAENDRVSRLVPCDPAAPPISFTRAACLAVVVCLTITLRAVAATPAALGTNIWFDYRQPPEVRAEALIREMTVEEKMSQLMDYSVAIPRLGIPEYNWWNEALHGVARNGRSTVFPQAIALGATFDTNIAFRVGSAIGDEARAKFVIAQRMGNHSRYAGLTFWTPNINIFRDPRWGRGQETYGEDPFLTAQLAVSFIRGLQGNDPRYLKAAACAKHFAVHSGPEALRHEFDAEVSKRDLFETYLPAFQAAVEHGQVVGVMGAYNRVLGQPASGDPFLLTELLRHRWGFDGYVVSDCGAVEDIWQAHKVVKSPAEAAALAIKAGLDLECGNTFGHLPEALKQGLLTDVDIDRALKRLLVIRLKLGFFDPMEANPFNQVKPDVVCGPAHVALAREEAAKSIVVVKNTKGVLPLKKDIRRLYVCGPQATSDEALIGNYYGMADDMASILSGIVGHVSLGTTVNYKFGQMPYQKNVNTMDWTTGEAMTSSEAVIAVMGIDAQMEGEEGDAVASPTRGDRLDLGLPTAQVEFVKRLREKGETPLIVVLTGGGPLVIPEIMDLADAVVLVWYPGQQGGNAVADVLFGDVNPAGRLPLTVPKLVDDLPPFEDYAMKGRTYRYMEKEPLLPFGFGLSYTKFKYAPIKLAASKFKLGQAVPVSVNVRNAGQRNGDEVVQLYLEQPGAGDTAALRKLVGFRRVHLEVGKSTMVTFNLDQQALGQFDADGNPVVPPGRYTVIVGGAVPIPRAQVLGAPLPQSAQFTIE